MDMFGSISRAWHPAERVATMKGFEFEQGKISDHAEKRWSAGEEKIPEEFVSSIVKAGTNRLGKAAAAPQLQELAETALGIQKLKQEKASAYQELAENAKGMRRLQEEKAFADKKLATMQAKVAKLEAERCEMNAYFEQQTALVEEQEEITQQIVQEREDIDAEMECLICQRKQIASDRAQLIIEMSIIDGERAELGARQMQLNSEQGKLEQARAEFDRARLQLDEDRAKFHSEHKSQADVDAEVEELDRRRAVLEADNKELASQTARLEVIHQEIEAQFAALNVEHAALDAQRATLDQQHRDLLAERAEVDAKVQELKADRAALDAEQEGMDQRWAVLDRDQSQMEKQRTLLDEQLSQIASEWAEVNAERSRLAELEADLADREMAVQELEAKHNVAIVDPFALKTARSVPPSGRQSILDRGDSPRELEFWQLPLRNSQDRIDHPASSQAQSDIDSCEEPQAIADSAASFCGLDFIKERAAQLKEERFRLWAAMSDPDELDRMLKHLQEREAHHAYREMQLQAREAALAEQDRHFEANDLLREFAHSQEVQLSAKEKDLEEMSGQLARRDEEIWVLQKDVSHLKERLLFAMDQCASSEKALRRATRRRRRWTKEPDESILTPLRHRGVSVDDLFEAGKGDNSLFTI